MNIEILFVFLKCEKTKEENDMWESIVEFLYKIWSL